MRILVMEDNDTKYGDIEKYLHDLGEEDITRCSTLNNGLRTLYNSLTEEKRFDLLILDMQMPRYEDRMYDIIKDAGLSVLERTKRRPVNTKIVLCSSDDLDINIDEYENLIGIIKYNHAVYLLPEFEKYTKMVYDEFPSETYVNIYNSFAENSIKRCISRKEAIDYIDADFHEELRIQTEENGKVIGVDLEIIDKVREEEYAKMTFKNGDIIEWSIPEIIDWFIKYFLLIWYN